MPIPLYFASISEKTNANVMQLGFGFHDGGALRLPQKRLSNVPIAIDDAIIPNQLDPQRLNALCRAADKGVFLDFERPQSAFHDALIKAVHKFAPFVWLPEKYRCDFQDVIAVCACAEPCNRWEAFAAERQRRHSNRWALELIPWNRTVKRENAATGKTVYLGTSVCMADFGAQSVRYYDTRQTLLKKLSIAAAYGCCGAVCLWEEWPRE